MHTSSSFALLDGWAMDIDALEERDRDRCICPVCGTQLVARTTFVHRRGVKCNADARLPMMARQLMYERAEACIAMERPLPLYIDQRSFIDSLSCTDAVEDAVDDVDK